MLSLLSEKLRISYPIILVIAGLGISLIPAMPRINLSPDIVFIIFLPPLLYSAAWHTSWKDFWNNRWPISMLALGLVIFTATGVAFVSNAIIPDFSLAFGFLLGGIISPPDAVAATSVLQGIRIPKRIVTILEGESLVNDASSLIVFRFALATVFTGTFTLWKAETDFLLVSGGGILVGLAIAHIVYAVHRFLPTTPSVDTAISLISPYLMYLIAEHFETSGVLSVVSGGLFLSFRSQDIYSYNSRLQVQSVWDTLVFLLNGVVFILIGLQLPDIVKGIGSYYLPEVIGYSVIISLVTIFIRILWVFPGAYIPRLLSKKIRQRETKPGWKQVFIVAWSGMRGVVSLASALSIPLTLTDGSGFPHRDLILFITFVVILFTLVLQGLTLPFVIRLLNIKAEDNEQEQELGIQYQISNAALGFIDAEYTEEVNNIEAFAQMRARYSRLAESADKKLEAEAKEKMFGFIPAYRKFLLQLVHVQRDELKKMRTEAKYSDELLRRKERELDLEEARLRK
ncbi:Na+/H+ antiporter [Filimonas lacunae]|nr:Na+/H+ antiporter [Filimonas lacunae]